MLRGIDDIDQDDMEVQDTMEHARKKLELPLESGVLCKAVTKHGKTCCVKSNNPEDKIRMHHRNPRIHEEAHWKVSTWRSYC